MKKAIALTSILNVGCLSFFLGKYWEQISQSKVAIICFMICLSIAVIERRFKPE